MQEGRLAQLNMKLSEQFSRWSSDSENVSVFKITYSSQSLVGSLVLLFYSLMRYFIFK